MTLHTQDQIAANRAADEFWGDDDDWRECWNCGGEGRDTTMCKCEYVVDICFCQRPEYVDCQTCDGEGGWEISPNDKPEDTS